MKKLAFISLFLVPVLFFSCASKPSADENPITEPEVITQEEEALENNKEEELTETESEETESSSSEETSDYFIEDDEEVFFLDEIVEPEVFDLELEDEIEIIEEIVTEDLDTELIVSDQNIDETVEAETSKEISSEINTNTANVNSVSNESNKDFGVSVNELLSVMNQEEDTVISEEDVEETEDESELKQFLDSIKPSRTITIKNYEYVDVTYPGTGWIYMGLADNSKDIKFMGRKLGADDTVFQLQASVPGRKLLHFYRNDSLTGGYIDDYLEVIVTEEKGSAKTHNIAPKFILPVSKKSNSQAKKIQTENKPIETESQNTVQNVSTVKSAKKDNIIQNDQSETEAQFIDDEIETVEVDTEALLKKAVESFNAKNYPKTLELINQFLDFSTTNRDYGLFIKGQTLEAQSEVQNISEALETYNSITSYYPSSKYWDKASKRAIYLKRFYLEGR